MNLGGILLILLLMISAIGGLFLIAANTSENVVTDTYGTAMNNQTNESKAAVTNLTATGTSVAAGGVIFVVLILFAILLLGFLAVASKKRW